MQSNPRYRLSTLAPLAAGASITLDGNAAHYIGTVLRMKAGDAVALFNRTDGEWRAVIADMRKREVVLQVEAPLRAPAAPVGLTVCFAPIKGGRLETIIEKATELGASVLQPVITSRTIVDKVNVERAEAIAREAAEQCERTDWPEIREPMKFTTFLGSWPTDMPLIYGDESGASAPIAELLGSSPCRGEAGRGPLSNAASPNTAKEALTYPDRPPPNLPPIGGGTRQWAVLAGPEGGFTPEEFAALKRVPAAIGTGLGPRILRADTAIITLCALTLAAWGDWSHAPRFIGGEK